MNAVRAAGVFWWHSSENLSPRVTPEFLARQRRILMPAQFAREHQNSWVDAADGFTTVADVDAAMGHGWTEQLEGRPGVRYVAFVDLGAVHDPSVIAVGHVEGDLAYIDKIITFQGSREAPVQLATVEEKQRDLARQFRLTKIRIESWQGMGAVQSLQRAGLPVELYTPTAKSHAEEWPVLAQRLSSRTLLLPLHARLREELLNLVVELGPTGVRVIDRGQVHQDHAVAVRGVVASFARPVDGFLGYLQMTPVDRERNRRDWEARSRDLNRETPAPAPAAPIPPPVELTREEYRQRQLEAYDRLEAAARRGARW